MTTEQVIGIILALVVMSLGVAGSVLPGLPSTPLVLIAAVAHKLYFGPTGVGGMVMTVLVLFTAVSMLMDYLATLLGARHLGATWRGTTGAVVGCLIGMFFSLPGILLGPFVGATVFELAGGRAFPESSRAGLGATLGLLAGAIGKVACCLAMMGLFVINVVYRSLTLQ
jgi:hypothetical protein